MLILRIMMMPVWQLFKYFIWCLRFDSWQCCSRCCCWWRWWSWFGLLKHNKQRLSQCKTNQCTYIHTYVCIHKRNKNWLICSHIVYFTPSATIFRHLACFKRRENIQKSWEQQVCCCCKFQKIRQTGPTEDRLRLKALKITDSINDLSWIFANKRNTRNSVCVLSIFN